MTCNRTYVPFFICVSARVTRFRRFLVVVLVVVVGKILKKI